MEKYKIPIEKKVIEIEINKINFKPIKSIFEIRPREFFKYAEYDLKIKEKQNGRRSLINSLTNSKRAIDSQLDLLLYCYGLYRLSNRKEWKVPQKIKILKKINISVPDLIIKVTNWRNNLEHRYKLPTKENVRESLDIAKLFLDSTEIYTSPIITEVLGTFNTKKIFISFDYDKEKIHIRMDNEFVGEVSSSHLKEYLKYLKLFAELGKEIKMEKQKNIREIVT
jgi:hypothetical protein